VWAGLGLAAFAKHPDKHNKKGEYSVFTDDQRRDISSCLANERSGLPPGLAKKDRLPPGLERQLQRNGHLPPGLEKKLAPLPERCEANLPRLPDGWRRVVLTDRVIILDAARVISDIFQIIRDVKSRR
jgi:hypothetical protein